MKTQGEKCRNNITGKQGGWRKRNTAPAFQRDNHRVCPSWMILFRPKKRRQGRASAWCRCRVILLSEPKRADASTPLRLFECFIKLIDKYRPKLFLHGHIHRNYNIGIPQKCSYGQTTVINAFEYCVVEVANDSIAFDRGER